MQRCATCGELAIDDDARFCIGCGGPIERFEAPAAPPPPRPRPAPGTAFIDAPIATAPPARAVPPAPSREPLAQAVRPDPAPLVPVWMVVAAVLGLVVLLVILLLSG